MVFPGTIILVKVEDVRRGIISIRSDGELWISNFVTRVSLNTVEFRCHSCRKGDNRKLSSTRPGKAAIRMRKISSNNYVQWGKYANGPRYIKSSEGYVTLVLHHLGHLGSLLNLEHRANKRTGLIICRLCNSGTAESAVRLGDNLGI